MQCVQHTPHAPFAATPWRKGNSFRAVRLDEWNSTFDQRELKVHCFVDQRFRHPLDSRASPAARHGKEHGKRQVWPTVTAIELGGGCLEHVDATHEGSDGRGQTGPNGMNNLPSLFQDTNTRRNRRVIGFTQRNAHSVKLGDCRGGKVLKQNGASLSSIWRIDVADDLPRVLDGPRHHARRAVGLEVEAARDQEIGNADLAQCRRQVRRPVNGTQQDVFHGMNNLHGGLPSVDRMKRIHDGVSLTADYLADCMMRAVGYLEKQGLF